MALEKNMGLEKCLVVQMYSAYILMELQCFREGKSERRFAAFFFSFFQLPHKIYFPLSYVQQQELSLSLSDGFFFVKFDTEIWV